MAFTIKYYYSLNPLYLAGDGKMLGYQLYPGKDSADFHANGFLPGDIVTQVNGLPLTNKKYGIRILRNLVKSDTYKLRKDELFEKQGVPVEIEVEFFQQPDAAESYRDGMLQIMDIVQRQVE